MASACVGHATPEVDVGQEPRLESAALQAVYLLGLLAVVGGVLVLGETDIGVDAGSALSAVASQLPITLMPALIIFGGAALNVSAGAVLVRILLGAPFASVAQAVLLGLAGAVLMNLLLMAVLGLLGLFRAPVLLAVNVGVLLVGVAALRARTRPFFVADRPALRFPRLGPVGWLLAAVVWSGPVLLQLASPVVPFNDVPPNHVAPVEHLRTFGSLSALDMTFSPIYGPSRIFLGYQALLGTISTIGDVPAVSALASFTLPLALLVAIAGCSLAAAIGGPRAAAWAVLLLPLSVTFLRLADARAGVVAFPLAALALWLTIEPYGGNPRRRAISLGLVLAATIFVHPLLGLFAAAAVGICGLARPRAYAAHALPAAIAAPIAALPQWTAMLGMDTAAATAIVALAAAGALLFALPSAGFQVLERLRLLAGLAAAATVLGAVALAIVDPGAVGRVIGGAAALIVDYAVLIGGTLIALWVALHRRGFDVLIAGVVAGLLAGSAALAVAGLTPLGEAFQYEVPKAVTYFAPTLMAIAAAVGLACLWARAEWKLPVRVAIAGIVLVAAAAPIRAGVVQTLSLGEHRLAESLSISLRTAERGYWQGYPDNRRLINAEQQELIDALRAEVAAGRLSDAEGVLHVAQTWRSDRAPAYATPLGVFAGVVETTATTDPEDSIHTTGGRLRDIADLDAMLGPSFPYLVLEGAGLPIDTVSRIQTAGYSSIFANGKGQISVFGE